MKFEVLTVDEILFEQLAIGLVQMRVRLKYLWSNHHRMTFMPGIGEFFHETDFFQIIRYLHFFDERNAPNRDTTPNYDIYYKVHYKVLHLF